MGGGDRAVRRGGGARGGGGAAQKARAHILKVKSLPSLIFSFNKIARKNA